MAYKVETLFKAMARSFHTQISDDSFQQNYVCAINTVVDELSFAAGLSTPIAHITAVNGSISELDPEHGSIITAGVIDALIKLGWEHSEGPSAYDRLQNNWIVKKNDFQVMKSREDQATQDDDGIPTSDIAGLGYLGDE
jgi:hypothetical protein